MNTDQARSLLDKERHRLEKLKKSNAENAELAEGQQDSLGALSSIDQHPADIATDTYERSKALSVDEQLDRQLDEIDEAIQRINEDSFGQCLECGAEIDTERLELLPTAKYCATHQAKREAQEK